MAQHEQAQYAVQGMRRWWHRLACRRVTSVPAALLLVVALVGIAPFPAQADTLDILIEGVDDAVEKNVERHIERMAISTGADGRRQLPLIRRSARNALEALGYYEADVRVTVDGDDDDADIRVQITPGEPVRWGDTAVKLDGAGATDPLFLAVLTRLSPTAGNPLNHDQYETLKKQLRLTAMNNGYFDADFRRQRLLVDRARHRADLDLEFDTGVRYRFGAVSFGPSRVKDKALQRYVPFRPGEPYEESKMTELNRNLLDSGYFQSVSLSPQRASAPAGEDPVVPVQVDLQDNEHNRVSVGLGYGTDTGPRVRLSWLKPLINTRGHSLQLDTSLSEPKRETTAQYKIPDGKPGVEFWLVQAGYLEEKFEDNEYSLLSYGVSRQQQVWGDWQRTLFTNFKHENGFVEGEYVENRASDSFYMAPGISFSRVQADGGLQPVRGYKLSVDLEFSDPWIGSDTEYVRVLGQAKYLFSLSERQQILLRSQAGMIWSDDFSQVPVSVRFYAGGDQSIRGFDYNTLSPIDAGDALVGGSRLLLGSAEYLFRVLPHWQAATFVDHGGALDETNHPLYTGAGVGVRWLSPVGNLSFDVAQALNGEREGKVRIHITMGTVL